ncbi:MAG TPA: D-alanyl-D-alanine carboxypeptidase [Pyrinomonadaceae bacterium]|jgi:D-alanyl-D-alanine carboxypeptidase/D-alanyl-D-alanine-endopeptidase (penicillin-binding protein 4)
MARQSSRIIFSLLLLLTCAHSARVLSQTKPAEQATPPNYTRPTVLTRPVAQPTAAQPATTTKTTAAPSQPASAGAVALPDIAPPPQPVIITHGLLVETLDGKLVAESAIDQPFNPASAVKLGTALAALRNFGADHRFATAVWTTGTFDPATGTITGDLIVSGSDPSFHYEHAVMIARELNKQGIRTVTGDLIVSPGFTMNFDWSAQRSGDQFYDTLDATRRSAAASRAWQEERSLVRDAESLQTTPSVAVMGAVYVSAVPTGARTLLIHKSSRLVDVLKVLLCYSNNFMAERIGDTLGGAPGVQSFLIRELKLSPAEIKLASTSGLGVNRVTPRAMMKILRALRDELARNKLTVADILPVAGVDPGTLEKRYTDFQERGSVIAKTGTLVRTDGGVSALVGQMRTRTGETLLFVIFNQRGSVWRFRESQDALVAQFQNARGGPAPFKYTAPPISVRLASTELKSAPARRDEYEPAEQ